MLKRRSPRRAPRVEALEPRTVLAMVLTTPAVLSMTSPNSPPGAQAVELDGAGNMIVAGTHSGGMTVAPVAPLGTKGTAFVAKVDAAGNGQWVKNIDQYTVKDVATDAAGNVYVLGAPFGGQQAILLNPTASQAESPLLMNNNGNQMTLLLKFSPNGALAWRKLFTWGVINEPGFVNPQSIAADATGNVFVSLTYNNRIADDGTTDFDGVYSTLPGLDTQKYTGGFQTSESATGIVKLDPTGRVLWSQGVGGGEGVEMAVAPSGDLMVAGTFSSLAVLGPAQVTPPPNHQEAFLVRLAAGNGQVAPVGIVVDTLAGRLSLGGLAIDGDGSAYLAGSYQGPGTFGSIQLTTTGAATTDGFLMKTSPGGAVQWAQAIGGGSGADRAVDVATNGQGQVFVAGDYSLTGNFGGATVPSLGDRDLYLAQYDANGRVIQVVTGGGNTFDSAGGIAVDRLGRVAYAASFGQVAPDATPPTLGGTNLPRSGGAMLVPLQFLRPSGTVAPLPATVPESFAVSWSAQSTLGTPTFDVYVSVDGGPLAPWLVGTPQTSAVYNAAPGHVYGFAVAVADQMGLRSDTPAAAQVLTTVPSNEAPTTIAIAGGPDGAMTGQPLSFLAAVATSANGAGAVVGVVQFFVDGAPIGGPVPVSGGTALLPGITLGPGTHQVTANFTGSGPFLPSSSAPLALTVAPPAVAVASAQVVKRRGQLVSLLVRFGDGLEARSASAAGSYRLVTAGRDKKLGTRDDKVVRIARVAYDPGTRGVTVTPRGAFSKALAYRLVVTGAVRDALGRPIDGNGDGQPGGDATFNLTKGRVARG